MLCDAVKRDMWGLRMPEADTAHECQTSVPIGMWYSNLHDGSAMPAP